VPATIVGIIEGGVAATEAVLGEGFAALGGHFVGLIHAKIGVLPLEGCMKCQDNILFRNSHCDQFVGDAIFGAIMLYPDPIFLDIDMEYAATHSLILVPTYIDELIVLILAINDGLYFDIAVNRFILTITTNYLFNIFRVVIYINHFAMTSFSMSYTISFNFCCMITICTNGRVKNPQ